MHELLTAAAISKPVVDNQDVSLYASLERIRSTFLFRFERLPRSILQGSYMTIRSTGALIFGILNIVGEFQLLRPARRLRMERIARTTRLFLFLTTSIFSRVCSTLFYRKLFHDLLGSGYGFLTCQRSPWCTRHGRLVLLTRFFLTLPFIPPAYYQRAIASNPGTAVKGTTSLPISF